MTNLSCKARIILFGREGGFSGSVLKLLLDSGLCVVGVVMSELNSIPHPFPAMVTQPEKPEIFEKIAGRNNITIVKYRNINDPELLFKIKDLLPDIVLVACFEEQIPETIWNDMGIPCWNLHPSMLPKYRGRSPLFSQIAESESDTGLTLHQVSGKLDAGDIIIQKKILLPSKLDKLTLDNWVAEHGVEIFMGALEQYLTGSLKINPQNEA